MLDREKKKVSVSYFFSFYPSQVDLKNIQFSKRILCLILSFCGLWYDKMHLYNFLNMLTICHFYSMYVTQEPLSAYMTLNKFLVSYIAISCQYGGRRLTSAPIVAWKCSFQVYFITWRRDSSTNNGPTDRPTKQPTNRRAWGFIQGKLNPISLYCAICDVEVVDMGSKTLMNDIWFIVRNCAHITMFKFSGYLWIHI